MRTQSFSEAEALALRDLDKSKKKKQAKEAKKVAKAKAAVAVIHCVGGKNQFERPGHARAHAHRDQLTPGVTPGGLDNLGGWSEDSDGPPPAFAEQSVQLGLREKALELLVIDPLSGFVNKNIININLTLLVLIEISRPPSRDPR